MLNLVAGTKPLTDPLLVFPGVPHPTEIALAVDPTGTTYVTALMKTGENEAKLVAARKTPKGSFSHLPSLTEGLLPDGAPGIGEASLFVDPMGQLHLLYHYKVELMSSKPRYQTLAGTVWSPSKTVENTGAKTYAGYNPRVVVSGSKKYAAYFYLREELDTAELRLASWESSKDAPKIEVLEQTIFSPDPTYPLYRVAMAVDRFGLLHLALVVPVKVSGKIVGRLEYRRQTRVGGTTKWLTDIVDDDVIPSEDSPAHVDLIVDENARPHIAYIGRNQVWYATRFDR